MKHYPVVTLFVLMGLLLILVPGVPTTASPLSVNPAHPLFSTADANAGWEEIGAGSASGGGTSDNSGLSVRSSVAIAPVSAPGRAQVTAALQTAPLMFVEDVGQFAGGARFQVRSGDRTLWLD